MRTQLQAYMNVSSRLPTSDDSVKKRLERAWQEVLSPRYEITENEDGIYHMTKLSTSLFDSNEREYIVTTNSCNCPDTFSARAGLCKHRLAVMILEEQKGE